jgi:uncharacterized membrane protein
MEIGVGRAILNSDFLSNANCRIEARRIKSWLEKDIIQLWAFNAISVISQFGHFTSFQLVEEDIHISNYRPQSLHGWQGIIIICNGDYHRFLLLCDFERRRATTTTC